MTRAKQLRIDRGLGVLAVCASADISPGTLRKIEDGDDSVQARPLAQLGRFYGVQASSLLGPALFFEPDFPEAA